jgi:hypothetical protein
MAKWRIINDATGDTVAEFGDSGELSCYSLATNVLSATTIGGTAITGTGEVKGASVAATDFVKATNVFVIGTTNGKTQTMTINTANTEVITLTFVGGLLTANTRA